jgi:signal transduction histidine kinase/CheY-like chemotaxis protein
MKSLNPEIVLTNLLEHMPASIYWKNANGIYLGCNTQQARSLGRQQSSEIINKTDFELWDKAVATRFWKNDCFVLETGKHKVIEEQAKINGKLATLLSLKAPLKDAQNQIVGTIGISLDISREKEAQAKLKQAKEAAEAADKAKTEFVHNISHDLRTPLAGIIGTAALIKQNLNKPFDIEEIKFLTDQLLTSGKALSQLLNEVLEILNIASGAIPLVKRKFNLKEKLEHIIQLNQCKASEKQLDLRLEYDEHIPCYLVGDAMRIQRLVLELVTNALNFTEKGQVKVIAALIRQDKKTAIIKIVVEDTGIGIAADKQQVIFTRFKRLTPAYEGIYRGTGLGLALVKQFVDELEGELYVDSKPQVGSTFTCILPLKLALLNEPFGADPTFIDKPIEVENAACGGEVKEAKLSTTLEQKTCLSKNSLRVLLVEDDKVAARVNQSLFKEFNCIVDIAENGKSAVQCAEHSIYDIIVVDIGLPDIGGNEVAKRIQTSYSSRNQNTPIVALTAHVNPKNREEYLQLGMRAVFMKPLLQDNIQEILDTFVKLP